jgi:hypothetical protein
MERGSYNVTTIEVVIAALGGVAGVTRLTGRSPQAVANWRALGRFAANLFLLMNSELESQGLSADPALWGQMTPDESAA